MDEPENESLEKPTARLEEILADLRQPLDLFRVKRRLGPGRSSVQYLAGHDVIDRANRIFNFAWSFDLVGQPVIVRWQKKLLLWSPQEKRKVPSLDVHGNPQTEDTGIVYVTGKVILDLDGRSYTHADLGRCIFTGDAPEALDVALAGSVTDCLKRCFRQAGDQFGNVFYERGTAENAGLDSGRAENSQKGNSVPYLPGTLSAKIFAVRQYSNGERVNGNPAEQEAFDQFKDTAGEIPASKEQLRAWLIRERNKGKSAALAG
ncbi:MAG: Rad52/Rad22 family DNA repair protein [Chloroflexi bacterium]|nr:Rad52/Rad22 family DNA repair protein [Chloroflexota bacterium]